MLEAGPKVTNQNRQIYSTPRAARLLENAKGEADRLKDEYIGAEHLFIAATMETQGDSAEILKEFGIRLTQRCEEFHAEVFVYSAAIWEPIADTVE